MRSHTVCCSPLQPQDKYKFSEKDSQDIADFLLPMLVYEPGKRATAQQMLSHPWVLDA